LGVPLYRVAYGKRKATDDESESVEIGEDSIPLEKKFEKGHWECVGTDGMNEGEWDGRFKPFGEHKRVSSQEWEKRNFGNAGEGEHSLKEYGGVDKSAKEEEWYQGN